MKTCPYCGKENPEDATVCAIDGQRLDPEMPPAVPSKTPRPKTVVDLSARPLAVKFAVSLLALEGFIEFVREIIIYESYHFGPSKYWYTSFWYTTIFAFTFEAVFLYFVYRGKNWARWVLLFVFLLGLASDLFTPKGSLHRDFYFFALIEIVALAALFQRSSNQWFKGSKQIVSEPEPAS